MSNNAASGSGKSFNKSNSSIPDKKKSGGYQKNNNRKRYFGRVITLISLIVIRLKQKVNVKILVIMYII